jgi:hypothetical protein
MITAYGSKSEQCWRHIKGVNQKNFGLFFVIRSDIQATQLLIKTDRLDKSVLRIILSNVVMIHALRRYVT